VKRDGVRDVQAGLAAVRALMNGATAALRSPARIIAVVLLTLVAGSIFIAPVNALWSKNLVLQGEVSLGGLLEGSQTPQATGTPRATPSPEGTPRPCDPASLANVHFDGDLALAGTAPFSGEIVVKNDGGETAHDVHIGFSTPQGWQYLKRIDFGNGQYWLLDGLPAATLYSLGDLAPGDIKHVTFTVQMMDDWLSTPPGTQAVLGARLADLQCPESEGEQIKITLEHDDEVTVTPSPESSGTAEPGASATATPTGTATATTSPQVGDETQTPASSSTPDATATIGAETATPATPTPETPSATHTPTAEPSETETPTPTATDTEEPSPSESPIATHTVVTRTSEAKTETPEPSETFAPPTQTKTPDPTHTPTSTIRTATHTTTPVPTSTITASPTLAPTGTVLAAVATVATNRVLGDQTTPRPTGQVLPGTGGGSSPAAPRGGVGFIILLGVALGLVGVAVGVGRRLT
jgi:hypothetical protein